MWSELLFRFVIVIGFVLVSAGVAFLLALVTKALGIIGFIGGLVLILFILVFIVTWLEWN